MVEKRFRKKFGTTSFDKLKSKILLIYNYKLNNVDPAAVLVNFNIGFKR